MGFDSGPISMTLAEYGSAGHFCPLYGPLKRSAEKFISMIVREFFYVARRDGLLGNHAAILHIADKILIALVCAPAWAMGYAALVLRFTARSRLMCILEMQMAVPLWG